jgi:hypothetical protein
LKKGFLEMARAERVRRIKNFLKQNLNNRIHKKEDTIIWHAKECRSRNMKLITINFIL